jgi:hypothetical protein
MKREELELLVTYTKGASGKMEFFIQSAGGAPCSSGNFEEALRWLLDRISNPKAGDGNSLRVSVKPYDDILEERARHRRLQMDGVKEADPNEWQSFLQETRSFGKRNYLGISIPWQVRDVLGLKPNEELLVALKRPSKQEVEEWKCRE